MFPTFLMALAWVSSAGAFPEGVGEEVIVELVFGGLDTGLELRLDLDGVSGVLEKKSIGLSDCGRENIVRLLC